MNADLLLSVAPLALLIYLMTRRNAVPAHRALPLCAIALYLVKLCWSGVDPNLANATVISGLLTAFTPLMIVWGAVLLSEVMEDSGGMDVIRQYLNSLTTNRVAHLMIVGWAFGFLIEGASGFGTPAALAAPVLVGLGFQPVAAAIFCLVMNSVPVSFGAVGTPTWFGLGELSLTSTEILAIGSTAGIIHAAASLVIPVVGLRLLLPWRDVRANLGFIYLSILSCVAPYLITAQFNYEFPSIIGGSFGLILSLVFAKFGVGLAKENAGISHPHVPIRQVVRAAFPIWMTVLLLLVTRVSQLGIKGILSATEPAWQAKLGSLGTFSVSRSLVVGLSGIFGTGENWQHKLLYVPSIVPFFIVACMAFLVFKMSKPQVLSIFNRSIQQVKKPLIALCGALVFVGLLMMSESGKESSAVMIGTALGDMAGGQWRGFASLLGALGSFFSGSNTVSNLTFAPIQAGIARAMHLDPIVVLSLQHVGGAMGNMICIHNIVAVCSVLGLQEKEGFILKRTILPMLIYGLIAGLIGLFLL